MTGQTDALGIGMYKEEGGGRALAREWQQLTTRPDDSILSEFFCPT